MLDLWWLRKYHRSGATHLQQTCGKHLQWNLSKTIPVCPFPACCFRFPFCGFALLCRCLCIWINGDEWPQSAFRNGLCLGNVWKFTFSIYPFPSKVQKKKKTTTTKSPELGLWRWDDTKCNRNTLKKNIQNKEGAFLQLSVFMGIPHCISHYMLSE